MTLKVSPNQWVILSFVLWVGVIGGGLGMLAGYASSPGSIGDVPDVWPAGLGIDRDPLAHTIVLSVHPKCPCTRSTIDELESVIANVRTKPRILALVFVPSPDQRTQEDESFARTSITKRLLRIPGVECIEDPGSELAQSFGALTSGHALVFAPDGSLVFSGGLTPTRAHTGPNTGSAALKVILTGRDPVAESAPVYGCPLCPEDEELIESSICDTQTITEGNERP